jgi:transcriptional adapter 3
MANKSKGKGRQSRSRNTTPSSGLSGSTTTASVGAVGVVGVPGYLDNDLSRLFSAVSVQYADLLEQSGGGGHIPDIKTLEIISEQLKSLSQIADSRGDTCNAGMRELSQRRKEVIEEQREQEMEREEDRVKMKREADDDEESRALKGSKVKKRKERPQKEDRPLAVGAHEVARQDGELGKTKLLGYFDCC